VKPSARHSFRTIIALALLGLTACSERTLTEAESTANGVSSSKRSATVLLSSEFAGTWPTGLDPATSTTGAANMSLMIAIFGGLFQVTANADGSDPQVTGVLASGYEFSADGRALTIHLRPGVMFSDGTPFNAEAVKFNFERNIDTPCSCSPISWPWDKQQRFTAPDEHTVVLHFSQPYPAAIHSLPGVNLNWIVSPTALRKLGETEFRVKPVGAGPFRVVSNQLSSKLVLERNPLYWEKGRPYLDQLTFQSINGDQAAYQAILAGDAHAYEGMTAIALIEDAKRHSELTVTTQPATSPLVIQLNTLIPPFDDQRAREAIYYATQTEAIRKGLFRNWYPATQTFTAPGGLFHHDTVPGYRTYDLQKARTVVQQLGGLKVKLGTTRNAITEQIITALQSQWREAGIETEIEAQDLGNLIRTFQSGQWQAMLQTAGSFDPESGVGLRFRFGDKSVYSGVRDAKLTQLIGTAAGTVDSRQRSEIYFEISRYLSDHAYAPFILAQGPAQLSRGLEGPGLTTKIPALLVNPGVRWQEVRLSAAAQ
jgi:peptide/nickel transport system substrate-binding protein